MHGHANSWINDAPHIAFGAKWPSTAIQSLVEHFDERNFDGKSIIAVNDETGGGHLMFMVSMREMIRIPVRFVN